MESTYETKTDAQTKLDEAKEYVNNRIIALEESIEETEYLTSDEISSLFS